MFRCPEDIRCCPEDNFIFLEDIFRCLEDMFRLLRTLLDVLTFFWCMEDNFRSMETIFWCPEDILRCFEDIFRCLEDIFWCPQDILWCSEDIFWWPEDIFWCSNESDALKLELLKSQLVPYQSTCKASFLLVCSSTMPSDQLTACLRDLALHFKTDPYDTVVFCKYSRKGPFCVLNSTDASTWGLNQISVSATDFLPQLDWETMKRSYPHREWFMIIIVYGSMLPPFPNNRAAIVGWLGR
jgi:hypothetical protein